MAAYGTMLSLTNTIHQIQNHPHPPISLDKLQIQPLIEKVAFLQDFLEHYTIDGEDSLEGRMIDAAHEAADIIESYIVDHIGAGSEANINSNHDDESLYRDLQKVINDLDSITKDVADLRFLTAGVKKKAWKRIAPSCTEDEDTWDYDEIYIMDKLNNNPYLEGDDKMKDVMNDIMGKLTDQKSSRRIIAIAGMGGSGKTTLAKSIYKHPLIGQYFDIRGWTKVSQKFNSERILLEVLRCLKNPVVGSSPFEHGELGQKLYQSLYGRRYLIVMDDIWDTDVWDRVKHFFPVNNNGSKVLITTRSSTVALRLDCSEYFQMNTIVENLNNNRYSEGHDSVMNDIIDKLTNQQSSRWIIAISGMGGIGKTTLAKRIYEDPFIVPHFDIRGWATVSQEINSKGILLEILLCLKSIGSEDMLNQMSEDDLGNTLYESLYGQRYLIVMDDIWGLGAWDRVKRFFPDNFNRSKVLITTRDLKVALQLDGPGCFQMRFLKVEESWNLLRGFVFQEQGCPLELEEVGKDIAKNCAGLPLSIVVIGGLLAKSKQTLEIWKHVLQNLSSVLNLEEDERCSRILKLSYNQLPVHLKPCFLYMAMFPEDLEIRVPALLKLWVAEGFVNPVAGHHSETVARVVYLNELVMRNMILVRAWGPTGRIKRCGIHDLLRDLSIKEAEKYKFFRTMKITHNPDPDQSWRVQRRISIHHSASEGEYIPLSLPEAVQSASRARTLIWNVDGHLPSVVPFRLLRILNGYDRFVHYELGLGELCHLVNLRHLFITAKLLELEFPPEFYLLWNLQTLAVDMDPEDENLLVLDIWRMPQLKHVKVVMLQLADPPPPLDEENEENSWMVLKNLETLKRVYNLRLGEEVVERIPNIKKLGIVYDEEAYGLDNLCRLHKLEALRCYSSLSRRIDLIVFPVMLRKLTLKGTCLGWEEMDARIGSLPYLEVLKLLMHAFVGPEWETTEGGFQSLKYLRINCCSDLEQWRAEATNFPRLERLVLVGLYKLNEIPLGIGDITTLREIKVVQCNDSTVLSANKILKEQKECLGEVDIRLELR